MLGSHSAGRTTSTLLLTSTFLACALVACAVREPSGAATSADAHDQLYLDFETTDASGTVLGPPANEGTAAVRIKVATTAGGTITSAGRGNGGRSARFPAYSDQVPGPMAIVVVRAQDDSLDPGDEDLTFGADVKLDAVSSGTTSDNGDNVVQRGGYDSAGQFKLQLDKGIPSCRVAGDDGVLFVRASHQIDRGAWYSVSCRRAKDRLRLTLVRSGVSDSRETWTSSGPTGHLSIEDLPLTVGGKATEAGKPAASADQLNGWLDDVFVSID